MAMKVVKGIGLFVVYPLFMLVLGFYGGVRLSAGFYPGARGQGSLLAPWVRTAPEDFSAYAEGGDEPDVFGEDGTAQTQTAGGVSQSPAEEEDDFPFGLSPEADGRMDKIGEDASREVSASSETLSVDTKYVLEETDVLTHSVVETTWRLPGKYVGMNREQFLEAMEIYEAFPPLSEMERGFVSLEVLSFSRERVVVRMNYRFVQPSASFYLAVYNNNVVVYLEDKETVFIETDIRLDTLPEELQQNIMRMMWIEDQEKLYDFLENYSS